MLESLERLYGINALSSLTEKVPRRLLPLASLGRLRASAALDTLSLDDGEELLLFIDSSLGEGNGRVLETIGEDLAARALGQGGVAKPGDLQGTVARLQAFLDHPFVDAPTLFELRRTDLGFSLTIGVIGRPRATRVLRHLAVGAVNAAERSAREGSGMRLTSKQLADRATLSVRYQRSEPSRAGSDPPPTSVRRPTHSSRPPSLSAEVERILGSGKARGSWPPPGPESRPAPPERPERTSQVQRTARVVERTSEVQPVAPLSPGCDGAHDAPLSERLRSKG